MAYLDLWRSGTFPEKQQASALLIANKYHRMTERSTSDSFDNVSWMQKATLQPYRRNVPLLHTSRYVIARDQFYQAFPTLVLQATNAGVRRPGHEAIVDTGYPISNSIIGLALPVSAQLFCSILKTEHTCHSGL